MWNECIKIFGILIVDWVCSPKCQNTKKLLNIVNYIYIYHFFYVVEKHHILIWKMSISNNIMNYEIPKSHLNINKSYLKSSLKHSMPRSFVYIYAASRKITFNYRINYLF